MKGQKLPHLTVAEGEVTGYKHCISEGQAQFYEKDGIYPSVLLTALLTHEEHKAISIPQRNWIVRIKREYEPFKWRYVGD